MIEWTHIRDGLPERAGYYLCFSENPMGGNWMSVCRYLPRAKGELVTYENKYGHWHLTSVWIDGPVTEHRVTHWTKLPDAPKKGRIDL